MRYDAIKRLETTIANLQVQKDCVYWDDYEKLENVLDWIKQAQPVVNAVLDNPEIQKMLGEAEAKKQWADIQKKATQDKKQQWVENHNGQGWTLTNEEA